METNPKFYLELARVTGCIWPSRGAENDPILPVDSTDLDSIDTSQFVRLPPQLFGPSENPSWRTIKSHCLSAYQSECFFRCISEEQWLRTVITCNSSYCGFSVHSIHSNVMPKQAYLTWLEGMKFTCPKHRCSLGFFPATLLGETMKLNMFSGLCCSNCALVEQLKYQMVAAEFVMFWYLEETDVRMVDDHTKVKGSEGEVHKILWRHGTFARKRFGCDIPYQNKSFEHEFDVALKVSHPNIVHSFGWSDGSFNCSLFMEWLEVDLQRFLHERVRDGRKSPFSFRVTLLVLLQVAEAMKHLHEQRFVHGDLKPGNLLMSTMAMPSSDAQFYLVKVADFGCTQRVDSSGATVEPFSYRIGTQFYIAPEVLRCRKHRGLEPPECLYKIDVYSFGVVTFQVVTGVESQDFPSGYNTDRVMKPDEEETQWRPNRDFDFDSLGHDRLSLLPLMESCCASSPHDRPTFQKICRDLWELYNQFFPEQVWRPDKSSLADIIVRKRSFKVPAVYFSQAYQLGSYTDSVKVEPHYETKVQWLDRVQSCSNEGHHTAKDTYVI